MPRPIISYNDLSASQSSDPGAGPSSSAVAQAPAPPTELNYDDEGGDDGGEVRVYAIAEPMLLDGPPVRGRAGRGRPPPEGRKAAAPVAAPAPAVEETKAQRKQTEQEKQEPMSYAMKKRLRQKRKAAEKKGAEQEQGKGAEAAPAPAAPAGGEHAAKRQKVDAVEGKQEKPKHLHQPNGRGHGEDQAQSPAYTQAQPQAEPEDDTHSEWAEAEAEGDEAYYGEEGDYEYDEEDYYDEDYDYEEEEEEEDSAPFLLNTNIQIPDIPVFDAHGMPIPAMPAATSTAKAGLKTGKGSQKTNPSDGRILTDEEVWADEALLEAFNAAGEEYALFHQGVTAANGKGSHGAPGVAVLEVNGDKRRTKSALWYDAPAPGSEAAEEARRVAEGNRQRRRLRAYMAEKERREAKAQEQHGAGKSSAQRMKGEEQAQPQAPPTRGTIPPSIGLAGNAAWQAACATVASTPNQIGASASAVASASGSRSGSGTILAPQLPTPAPAPAPALGLGGTATAPLPVPVPPTAPPGGGPEDTFHNICQAWYAAGYYTAQWEAFRAAGGGGGDADAGEGP